MLTALPLLRNTQNIFNSDWLAHGWLAGLLLLLLRLLARPTKSACAAHTHRARTRLTLIPSFAYREILHTFCFWHCGAAATAATATAGWLDGESACNTVCRRCLRSRINYSVCIMETNKFLMAFTRHEARARAPHKEPVNEWKSCENFTSHFLIAYSVFGCGCNFLGCFFQHRGRC